MEINKIKQIILSSKFLGEELTAENICNVYNATSGDKVTVEEVSQFIEDMRNKSTRDVSHISRLSDCIGEKTEGMRLFNMITSSARHVMPENIIKDVFESETESAIANSVRSKLEIDKSTRELMCDKVISTTRWINPELDTDLVIEIMDKYEDEMLHIEDICKDYNEITGDDISPSDLFIKDDIE